MRTATQIFTRLTAAETKNVFNGIGVLGIPFRYSVKIAEIMKTVKNKKTGNITAPGFLV